MIMSCIKLKLTFAFIVTVALLLECLECPPMMMMEPNQATDLMAVMMVVGVVGEGEGEGEVVLAEDERKVTLNI